jgi:hypothetical protein
LSRLCIRVGELAVDIEAFALSNQIMRRPLADREENHDPRASEPAAKAGLTTKARLENGSSVGKVFLKFLHSAGWCGHVSGFSCGFSIAAGHNTFRASRVPIDCSHLKCYGLNGFSRAGGPHFADRLFLVQMRDSVGRTQYDK